MPRNKKKIDSSIFILFGIIALLATMVVIIFINIQSDDITRHFEEDTILPLIVFIAEEKELIMSQLVLIDSNVKSMAIFDIPISIGSIIPSLDRVDRLDNYYADLGTERTLSVLNALFGTTINFYLDIQRKDLEVLVDLLEGLPIFVPTPIEDSVDGNIIRIPGGNSRLDGEKITMLISYQGEEERELEWISRRWGFTRELFRRIGEYSLLRENNALFTRFKQNIGANFDSQGLTTLVNLISEIDLTNVLTQRILGAEREVETIDGTETLLFPYFDGQLIRDSYRQVSQNLASLNDISPSFTINLEILNGTTRTGLASRTSDLYRNFGFEVLRIANADTLYDNTLIIDRVGIPEEAEKVAKLIRSNRIQEDIPREDNPNIDITIILGSDFDGLYVQPQESEEVNSQ